MILLDIILIKAHFYIKVVTGKSSKSGGEKKVNLSYYPNNNINQRTEILSMEKGIDGGCKLHLNIKCNKLGEAQENDSDSDAFLDFLFILIMFFIEAKNLKHQDLMSLLIKN